MVATCEEYKNGNCQIMNVKDKNYNAVLNGYEGVSCPEKEGKELCGWYEIKKLR